MFASRASSLLVTYQIIGWADRGNVMVVAVRTKVLLSRPFGFSVRFPGPGCTLSPLIVPDLAGCGRRRAVFVVAIPLVVDGLHC